MFLRKSINYKVSSHFKEISLLFFFHVRGSQNEFESAMSSQSTNYLHSPVTEGFLPSAKKHPENGHDGWPSILIYLCSTRPQIFAILHFTAHHNVCFLLFIQKAIANRITQNGFDTLYVPMFLFIYLACLFGVSSCKF